MSELDDKARGVLSEWASLQGHNRCWFYEEYIVPLAKIYDLSLEGMTLIPRTPDLFQEACARFRREQYHENPHTFKHTCTNARDLLALWIDQNGGRKMSYHDEILRGLATMLNVELPSRPNVSESELREGCNSFRLNLYEIGL